MEALRRRTTRGRLGPAWSGRFGQRRHLRVEDDPGGQPARGGTDGPEDLQLARSSRCREEDARLDGSRRGRHGASKAAQASVRPPEGRRAGRRTRPGAAAFPTSHGAATTEPVRAAGRAGARPSGRPAATRPARARRACRTGPTGRTGRRAASVRARPASRPSPGHRRAYEHPTGSSTPRPCTARRTRNGARTCRAPRPPPGPTMPAPSRRPPPGGVGRGSQRRGAWLAGSRSAAPGWGWVRLRRPPCPADEARRRVPSRAFAADHVGGAPGRRQGLAPDSARGLDRSAASG